MRVLTDLKKIRRYESADRFKKTRGYESADRFKKNKRTDFKKKQRDIFLKQI